MGYGKREKEGKQGEKEGSQDKTSPREKERQLKSAKREAYEIPSIASYLLRKSEERESAKAEEDHANNYTSFSPSSCDTFVLRSASKVLAIRPKV